MLFRSRTYGLFAANPFGLHDFYNDKSKDGSHRMMPGDSFTLRYRVVLHAGDAAAGKIAERFAAYAKEDPAATAGQDLNSPSRSPRRRILSMLRR